MLSPDQSLHALALMQTVAARTSKTAIAARMGVSRTAVSLVLGGKYPAKRDKIFAAALAALDQHNCPYMGIEVAGDYCRDMSTGPTPTWDPSALAQRRVCATCNHNTGAKP